jgi:hypothetical protein
VRNTSSTDPDNRFPYDTSGFKDIPPNSYMFFNVPNDLSGLDISNGQCYNSSVKQNVTFGQQGLPFGLDNVAGVLAPSGVWAGIVGMIMLMPLLL